MKDIEVCIFILCCPFLGWLANDSRSVNMAIYKEKKRISADRMHSGFSFENMYIETNCKA